MFKIIISIPKRIISALINAFHTPYFGFIEGHSHLNKHHLASIKRLIGVEHNDIVEKFENGFSRIIGNGKCISYAAGRMGFFDLMKLQGIGVDDEVILTGATCAVMVNAVLRIGATPIYSDIDPATFGSSCKAIESCITDSTKMIVAQHSFGIPCDIRNIQLLASSKDIFLLEDCALTLGSSVDGVVVGNFGDAALFSTDHSKPINTLTGGMIYTKNINLANRLRSSRDLHGTLSIKKQYALWRRFLLERKFCNPQHYGKLQLIDFMYAIINKFIPLTNPFLSGDFNSILSTSNYPYPAKLPSFLAQIGVYEVERWELNAVTRKALLSSLLNTVSNSNVRGHLSKIYFKSSVDIVPLRFVWSEYNGLSRRKLFSHFVHVDRTWFMRPIIATNEPLENFSYIGGACAISESIGSGMINIPCNIKKDDQEKLLNEIKNVLL